MTDAVPAQQRTHAYVAAHHDDDDDDDEEDEEDPSDVASVHSAAADDDDATTGIFPDRPPSKSHGSHHPRRRRRTTALRRFLSITKEALPTLLLSLLSLVFSGELLVHLARWPVFRKVDKLFILIPILLNLKGNLEMNLSLRMSTSANIGELDIRSTRQTLIVGNMTLLQVQALIVSAGAGVLAFLLGMGASKGGVTPTATALTRRRVIHHHPKPPVDPALRLRNGYFEFVLVLATGMLTASLSSAVLGYFMCALVVVARAAGANPDNIASPLAASLGDLLSLTLAGLIASFLVRFEGTLLASVILALLLAACGTCLHFTLRNTYVRELLSSGWVPLLVAMFISSGAGLVLDAFVQRFQGFALLAPVVTGLPGACAAIFVSRTSTALHAGKGEVRLRSGGAAVGGAAAAAARRPPRTTLLTHARRLLTPTEGALIPLTLLALGLAIQALFLAFVGLTAQMHFRWPFIAAYALVSLVAQGFALALAHGMTLFLWERDWDPDIYCLPYVSSLIDVVAQLLLVGAFTLARAMGDDVRASFGGGGGAAGGGEQSGA